MGFDTVFRFGKLIDFQIFQNASWPLRTVSDYASYKRLHSTLSAAVLSAYKLRVRAGEPKAVRELWASRDRTFLAIDFEWSERNEKSCLEWGYAAVRCGHLESLGHWPPVPDANYRKGHCIVQEYVDKVINKHCPTHPWQHPNPFPGTLSVTVKFAPKRNYHKLFRRSLFSLALTRRRDDFQFIGARGTRISGDLARMEEMKTKLPHNMFILDTATFERALFA
ncbi:hypothetical protein K438DRAFT_1982592 [Mycena galopus ATCC 62051]|nr:hypothetical protein K438DRAFT_1982592 [Mycena galopus ATCC 62051]